MGLCFPILSKDKTEFIEFVDSIIRADLPNPTKEPRVYELVSKVEIHKHSRSCRKFQNVLCRFDYGRYFTERTITTEPLGNDKDDNEKLLNFEKT